MKILVDIPEKFYEDFKLQLPAINKEVPSDFAKYAIATGTPLPKGHGDLIDRGQALNECIKGVR